MAHKRHWPSTGDWRRSPGTGCINKAGGDEVSPHPGQKGGQSRSIMLTKEKKSANMARLDGTVFGVKGIGGTWIHGWAEGELCSRHGAFKHGRWVHLFITNIACLFIST